MHAVEKQACIATQADSEDVTRRRRAQGSAGSVDAGSVAVCGAELE
jgi:hypothetical protein